MPYEVIVAGIGAMGSAAAYHLARRGKRVLGLERFDIPHALGSSHGVNRIIRRSYYEHPAYVPLLGRAYELWRALQAAAGEQLLWVTGGVDAGPETHQTFRNSLAACLAYGLAHEVVDARELERRYPAYRLPPETMAVFQPESGFVASERGIVAHVAAAQALGADIRARERVLGWSAGHGRVQVRTERGTYEAGQLVLSAGSWNSDLAPTLAKSFVPERQVLGWFQPIRPDLFTPDRFPVFNVTVEEGDYYGFPVHAVPGFKFGRHHHLNEAVDAESFDRAPHPRDEQVLRDFARRYFPDGNGATMALKTCLYTNTADEHFVIDRHPGHAEVLVASPCSGHGYKFCPVIGEILADLATVGQTRHDIDLFRLDRPALAA